MNYTMNSTMEENLEALFEQAGVDSVDRQTVLNSIECHYEELLGINPQGDDDLRVQVVSDWVSSINQASSDAGWWDEVKEFQDFIEIIKSSKISLIHSEVSEALEGVRKGCQDRHLPDRKTEEVELADAVIRIFDYCGQFGISLADAMVEKLKYNKKRSDHKRDARAADGGKKI